MIGYIEGTLLRKDEDHILLLANHIGYEILVITSYSIHYTKLYEFFEFFEFVEFIELLLA